MSWWHGVLRHFHIPRSRSDSETISFPALGTQNKTLKNKHQEEFEAKHRGQSVAWRLWEGSSPEARKFWPSGKRQLATPPISIPHIPLSNPTRGLHQCQTKHIPWTICTTNTINLSSSKNVHRFTQEGVTLKRGDVKALNTGKLCNCLPQRGGHMPSGPPLPQKSPAS